MRRKINTEPEYLQLSSAEKTKIKKGLLIAPIVCLIFLIIMLLGELAPTKAPFSFTKFRYLFKANYIASDFIRGDIDTVLSHNLAFHDTSELNYALYGGIDDMYEIVTDATTKAYEATLKDKYAITLMVGMNYRSGGGNGSDAGGTWTSIGFVHCQGEDILKIEITFLSPEIYMLRVSPVFEGESDDPGFKDYLNSDRYILWHDAEKKINWMDKITSNQNDFLKNIGKVFKLPTSSPLALEKSVTNLFTNSRVEIGQTEEQDVAYASDLAWMLYAMNQELTIGDAYLSIGRYDTILHCTTANLTFVLYDDNYNEATLSLLLLYTPEGYQIVPGKTQYTHELQFDSRSVPELLEFIETGKMPEELILQRAKSQLTMESQSIVSSDVNP